MKNLIAMAFPILPGQTEHWRRFSNTLKGEKLNEFKANRKLLEVRERTFLQQTPMGDFVVVTLEGEDPIGAFTKFALGDDAFTKWFVKEVSEIHGVDFTNPPKNPMPELVVDSGELRTVLSF